MTGLIKKLILIAFVGMIFAPGFANAAAVTGTQATANMRAQRDRLQAEITAAERAGTAKEQITTNGKAWVNAGGAVLGGVAGGILGYQATRSVQMANAEGEAREWLENVGRHIKCYIGGDEVGDYGYIISTELE